MEILSYFYIVAFIALSLLGIISFTLFIKRLLVNASIRNNHSKEIGYKLDKIIDLLEKEPK